MSKLDRNSFSIVLSPDTIECSFRSAYCCKNWQYINKDEVVTGIQTVSVPKTHTVIVGYRDCNGNVNSTG